MNYGEFNFRRLKECFEKNGQYGCSCEVSRNAFKVDW